MITFYKIYFLLQPLNYLLAMNYNRWISNAVWLRLVEGESWICIFHHQVNVIFDERSTLKVAPLIRCWHMAYHEKRCLMQLCLSCVNELCMEENASGNCVFPMLACCRPFFFFFFLSFSFLHRCNCNLRFSLCHVESHLQIELAEI